MKRHPWLGVLAGILGFLGLVVVAAAIGFTWLMSSYGSNK